MISEEKGRYEFRRIGTDLNVIDHDGGRHTTIAAITYLDDQETNSIVALGIDEREKSPTPPNFLITHLDLGDFSERARYTTQKVGLSQVDKVESGYFLSGPRGFQVIAVNGDDLEIVKKEHYPMPGSFTKGLARVGIGLVGATAMLASAGDFSVGKNAGDYEKFDQRVNTAGTTSDMGISYFTLEERSQVKNKYAYFFGRDDDRELSLFQIEKNNGEEIERYIFDDKSPLYETDAIYSKLYYVNDGQLDIYELQK